MILHVVDANCSWIRLLSGSLPASWSIRTYRIYSPHWLPNGARDLLKCFRRREIDFRTDETYVVVPGWNKAPLLSAHILQANLYRSLQRHAASSAVLFTFPFYSPVAAWIKASFPGIPIAYHAHDPFEFYSYPIGYIRRHEDQIIPICDRVFAISDRLRDDLKDRYPLAKVDVLANGISEFNLLDSDCVEPSVFRMIKSQGSPIVGVIGQINSSYDWDLLEAAASQNPTMQLLFIGNLFEEGVITLRIREFFQRENVHWLGSKPHSELKAFMDKCDILLNPLAVNPHNHRRDPLRLYDYLSTKATVVSTPLDSARRHGDLVWVAPSESDLIRFLGHRPDDVSDEEVARRRSYLSANTWASRGRQLVDAFLPEIA